MSQERDIEPHREREMKLDISEQDPIARIAAAELEHRLRNLLIIVRILVTRTLDTAHTLDDARMIISERLDAVGRSADLLLRTDWEAVSLQQLVQMALAHASSLSQRVSISGPDVMIAPDAVLPLVLALHELETNAIKYGALSSSSGRIDIAWRVIGDRDQAQLSLRWTELDGPTVIPSGHTGFGSRLATSLLQQRVSGMVDYCLAPAGATWHLLAPLPSILAHPVSTPDGKLGSAVGNSGEVGGKHLEVDV
jgi:two-component sensor histidine kinase